MQFQIVFINVLIMLLYLFCGFFIVKIKKAETSHAKTLSGLLLYILGPCMIINSFLTMEYSKENFHKSVIFFFTTIVIQVLFFALLYLLFHKKYLDAKYRVLSIGAFLGNVGFFGIPLVSSIFPSSAIVVCYATIFVTSMNILVFTIGLFMITNDAKYMSIKDAVFNPTVLAMAVSLPLYLCRIEVPLQLYNAINLLAKMTTPVCMFVLGMRLSSMSFKEIFMQPFSYVVCLFKLIIYPLFAYMLVYPLPFVDHTFKICILILCATPSAAVILSLSEIYNCEQKLTANVVLMSTLLSIITLPILLFFIH